MFRNTRQRGLARLLGRASAIAVAAGVMTLGLQVTGHGIAVGPTAAHAKGQGADHSDHAGGNGNGGGIGGGQANAGPNTDDTNPSGFDTIDGKTHSLMRGFNAAHSFKNGQAQFHAAPNSMIGKVKAYETAVLGARQAQSDLVALEKAIADALNAANNTTLTSADIAAMSFDTLAGALSAAQITTFDSQLTSLQGTYTSANSLDDVSTAIQGSVDTAFNSGTNQNLSGTDLTNAENAVNGLLGIGQ